MYQHCPTCTCGAQQTSNLDALMTYVFGATPMPAPNLRPQSAAKEVSYNAHLERNQDRADTD